MESCIATRFPHISGERSDRRTCYFYHRLEGHFAHGKRGRSWRSAVPEDLFVQNIQYVSYMAGISVVTVVAETECINSNMHRLTDSGKRNMRNENTPLRGLCVGGTLTKK